VTRSHLSKTAGRTARSVDAMSNPHPITPVLVYEDITAAHEFLVQTFGLQPGGVSRSADGHAVHGEVRVAGAPIWLHRVASEHGLAAAASVPAQSGGLVVDVDDVDAHYAHSRNAGAQVQGPPANQPYGRREYGVVDLEGHHWWFGTPVASE